MKRLKRQIVLDTETTGLSTADGHRIIEIAAVEMINRKLTGKYFHYYINPERQIDKGAQQVHGITEAFLADKPKFAQIAEAFMEFIQEAELIIHNAVFDTGFIENELNLINYNNRKKIQLDKYCTILDTLPLARSLHPGQKNNLDALCKRYNVDNSSRELHGALLDANLLAHVYLAMTGGQGALFDEEYSETADADKQKPSKADTQADINALAQAQLAFKELTVLRATEEESQLHQQRLLKLEERQNSAK